MRKAISCRDNLFKGMLRFLSRKILYRKVAKVHLVVSDFLITLYKVPLGAFFENYTIQSNMACMSAFIMSLVFMELCPNTMALGAVATGRAKAYEQTMPAGRVR